MAAQDVRNFVADTLGGFLADHGLELYHVDFRREGKERVLEVLIDRIQNDPDGETLYVGSEDCELVSRFLEKKLDETDLIRQSYVLTVSSPGLERQLFEPEHYQRFSGRRAAVRLYQAMDGAKELTGVLQGLEENAAVILLDNGAERRIPLEKIAKANLVFEF